MSSLCWAFASSSMIRKSLEYFFEKYKDDADLGLTETERSGLAKWLKDNAFHSILRSQITMNAIPKRIKKETSPGTRANKENISSYLEFSERVSYIQKKV